MIFHLSIPITYRPKILQDTFTEEKVQIQFEDEYKFVLIGFTLQSRLKLHYLWTHVSCYKCLDSPVFHLCFVTTQVIIVKKSLIIPNIWCIKNSTVFILLKSIILPYTCNEFHK